MDFGVTLRDVLEMPGLQDVALVLVGSKNLGRKVSWVHILEIRDDITEYVNGDELVLTTGIGFENTEIAVEFLRQLIARNVSALCIEAFYYYKVIPQAMIDLAKEHDFPLIIFSKAVRFIDITREINTRIISSSSKIFQHVDYYEHQLKFLAENQSIDESVAYTARYLKLNIAYLPYHNKPYHSDPTMATVLERWVHQYRDDIKEDRIFSKENFLAKMLKVVGKPYGILAFHSNERDLTQFEMLILDRLADKLEHDIMKEMLVKEEALRKNYGWLRDWLEGKLRERDVLTHLRHMGLQYGKIGAQVFLVDILRCDRNTPMDAFRFNEDFLLHTNAIVRKTFEDAGLCLLSYMENNTFIYILLAPAPGKEVWAHVNGLVETLRDRQNPYIDYSKAHFSLGKRVYRCEDLHLSYDTAWIAMEIVKKQHRQTVFYEELYIDRILYGLAEGELLADFIADHLGDLVRPENKELLHTLMTFFECNCSKQKTAEKLFVVRQTLYFRLQKIEDILGEGFDRGAKRFALEFALHAYLFGKNNGHLTV